MVDRVVGVHSDDAVPRCAASPANYGLVGGTEFGRHMVLARRSAKSWVSATVVTVLCDEGEKYLSEYFIPATLRRRSAET